MTRARSWLRIVEIALAAALVFGGRAIVVAWVPRAWLAAGLAAIAAGALLFAKALLFDAPASSRLHRSRRKLALAAGSSAVTLLALAFVGARIDAGPTAASASKHKPLAGTQVVDSADDPELGWGPLGPPEYVGQRLDVIDPAKEHLVMVGDSVMYGNGVEKEQTAAYLVGQRYTAYQGLNLSVSGWSPDQYYLYLQRTLPKVHSKLTIVSVFAGNDLQFTGREWNYGHSKPLLEARDGALVRVDTASRCTDGLSRSALFRLLWGWKHFAVNLVRLACAPREMTMAETEASARAIFAGIEELGRRHGTPILFMLLPVGEDWGFPAKAERVKYTGKYADLRRLLREGGHALYEPYLDLARSGRKIDEIYIDPGHYTPEGHRILAEGMIRYIDAHYDLGRGARRAPGPVATPRGSEPPAPGAAPP